MVGKEEASESSFGLEEFGIGRLFHSIRDAVILANASTEQIVLWNPAATSMFGYTKEQATGMPLHALVPHRLHRAHRRGIRLYADTGQPGPLLVRTTPVEVPAVRKDGREIEVQLTLTPVPGASRPGRFVVAMIRDITERKRLELELEAHRERLTKALSLEKEAAGSLRALDKARNDFIAMVVHDLRNPVSVAEAHEQPWR